MARGAIGTQVRGVCSGCCILAVLVLEVKRVFSLRRSVLRIGRATHRQTLNSALKRASALRAARFGQSGQDVLAAFAARHSARVSISWKTANSEQAVGKVGDQADDPPRIRTENPKYR